jgi:transposase
MLWGRRRRNGTIVAAYKLMERLMPQPNDLSRSLVALDQNSTIIAVVEMSQSSWLVGGILPGIERQPRKKLEPRPERLLALLHRWRDESVRAGRTITRIAVAFEAGRDGFWLARWLEARGVEAHVIHPSSVAVSREHRRAKTDRLDTALLQRGFLGWLRGERGHCSMVRVPTIAEEDAKRPNREREGLVKERTRLGNRMKGTLARLGIRNFKPTLRQAAERLATLHTPEGTPVPPNTLAELQRDVARLGFVVGQIKQIEKARQKRLEQPESASGPQAQVRLLARVVGIGIETADMLVHEVLTRRMRDRRAVARYAGLTGAPDESGARRREQGLARAGNARVRRGMVQLAWRFLRFQKGSALTLWYQARTADGRASTRKTMIVALARKLLIGLWRFVTTGELLEGVILRPAG